MSIGSFFKIAERTIINNSPTILTAFGVTGTLTTAYLTGKATFKAADIIREEQGKRAFHEDAAALPPFETKDKVKRVWKCYIPPAIAVVSTIGCIVGANTINTSRMAALAAAYAVSDRNFAEYKDKVKETFGLKKEGDVRAAIAEDAANSTPLGTVERGIGGDTLCLDRWTGRFFTSDMQSLRAAENELSKAMYKGEPVITLADLYDRIGLTVPKCAEEVGWNADAPLELVFDSVLRNDKPVLVMDFGTVPFAIRGLFG